MNIFVLDEGLNKIDIFDYAGSVIWTKRYFTPGDFEVVVPANKKTVLLFRKGRFLMKEGDAEDIMQIRKVILNTEEEEDDTLIISGQSIRSCLNQRVVWKQTEMYGTVAAGIQRLLYENAIGPEDKERKMEFLQCGSFCAESFALPLTKQITGEPLGDAIFAICTTYGLGSRILLDKSRLLFEVYAGIDRSYHQTKNAFVVFSPNYGNLITSNYTTDSANLKNVAMVAGEGEGAARKKAIVGTAAGWNRHEIFVDKRDVSTNDGEISEDEYMAQLAEAGKECLAEHQVTEAFESEVASEVNYTYGTDYLLGDIIQVENEYGIQAVARITEVIEYEDETGHRYIPTFSTITEV